MLVIWLRTHSFFIILIQLWIYFMICSDFLRFILAVYHNFMLYTTRNKKQLIKIQQIYRNCMIFYSLCCAITNRVRGLFEQCKKRRFLFNLRKTHQQTRISFETFSIFSTIPLYTRPTVFFSFNSG